MSMAAERRRSRAPRAAPLRSPAPRSRRSRGARTQPRARRVAAEHAGASPSVLGARARLELRAVMAAALYQLDRDRSARAPRLDDADESRAVASRDLGRRGPGRFARGRSGEKTRYVRRRRRLLAG